jgi:hypothetical protein
MITCPWCGTQYETFQSNCKNCGGPLRAPVAAAAVGEDAAAASDSIVMPPPPPRQFADDYAWRLLRSDSWALAAAVLGLLGAIFGGVGVVLTLAIVTAFVGLPFAGLGVVFLGLGGALILWRYQEAQNTLNILRRGEAARGRIVNLEENYAVSINGRHPWIITYRFRAGERDYQDRLTTMNPPGPDYAPGAGTCVLYMPDAPEHNALYPHP